MVNKLIDHISKHIAVYGVGVAALLILTALYNYFSQKPATSIPTTVYKHTVQAKYGVSVGASTESDLTKMGTLVSKKDLSDGKVMYEFPYDKVVITDQGKVVFVSYYPDSFEAKSIGKNVAQYGNHDLLLFARHEGYETHVYLDDGVAVTHNIGESPTNPTFISEVRYFVPTNKQTFMEKFAEGLYENESDVPREIEEY